MKVGLRGLVGSVMVLGVFACRDREAGGVASTSGWEGDAAITERHVLARPDYRLPDGSVVTVTHNLVLRDATMTLSQGGQKTLGSMSMAAESALRMELVSPEVTRVTVAKDVRSASHTMAGVAQPGEPEHSLLEGRTVTFTRRGGEWVGALESGEASEEETRKMAALAKHLVDDEAVDLFGTEARAVGESWEVDPKNAAVIGEGADFKGRYRLRFERVEKIDGEDCAVLSGLIDVSGPPDAENPGAGEIKVVARAIFHRSLETFATVWSEIEGELVKAEYPAAGEAAMVRGPLRIVRQTVVVRP
jgi:hypothetical protein